VGTTSVGVDLSWVNLEGWVDDEAIAADAKGVEVSVGCPPSGAVWTVSEGALDAGFEGGGSWNVW
jgi:hypothetical protein